MLDRLVYSLVAIPLIFTIGLGSAYAQTYEFSHQIGGGGGQMQVRLIIYKE